MVKNKIGRWKCHAFEFLPCIGFKKIYYIVLLAYLGEGGEAKWVGVRVVFHSRAYIFTSVSCSKMGKHNKEKRKNFEKKRKKSQQLKKLKNKNRRDLQKNDMPSQTETSVNTTPTNSTPSTCSTSTVKSPFHLDQVQIACLVNKQETP